MMRDNLTPAQEQVYELPPLLRICLARDILYDILRNELAESTQLGGFLKTDVLNAWKALEKGPHANDPTYNPSQGYDVKPSYGDEGDTE